MTIRFAAAARNAALNTALNLADGGSGAGTIKLYSGAQPASGDTAASGTLLATITLNKPAFSAAASGTKDLVVSPALTVNAAATGTVGWARCADSAGVTVFDGSVGSSGADFTISSTSLTAGSPVTLTLGSITFPA